MTREFFNKQFAALVNAYTVAQKLADESQDVYWEMLKEIPEQKFVDGVKSCLARLTFFPTIHELGVASLPVKSRKIRTATRFISVDLDWYDQIKELRGENFEVDSKVRKLIPEF